MPPDEKSIVDWVNFPDGITTLSLWDTLHDGVLISIESDLFARTVTLRFVVGYVSDFHHLSEQTRFVIVINGVRSVRSLKSVPWPGGCSIPQGMPSAQQDALITEYHRKWRQESQSWSDFETSVSDGLEVSNAILGRSTDVVALQLGLLMANGSYIEAYIRGENITFHIGERPVTPEEFVRFGEAYWEAFAGKRKGYSPSE